MSSNLPMIPIGSTFYDGRNSGSQQSDHIQLNTTIPAQAFPEDTSLDSKRRRIARACDMCRKKKIKCDGQAPACSHCINYKTECIFTLVEKKRSAPKGAKYIEGLENRLGRMEALLKQSGLLLENDSTDLGVLEQRLRESPPRNTERGGNSYVGKFEPESSQESPSASLLTAPDSPPTPKDTSEIDELTHQMCLLVTNGSGDVRFIGSSSGFSIFSPKGLEWISEKTGDDSFLKLIQIDNYPSHPGKCEAFGDIFQRRSKHPLPSKKVARMLVEDFFRRFNTLYPLFHPPSFYNFFEKQYSDEPPSHNGWYSAFNMVLAVACRLRVSTSLGPRNIDDENSVSSQEAWNYFQNAGVNLTDLLMRNTDLISIQAIITMALFLQGTANPQPSYFLVAAAARIAISIGMHRKGSCFRMSAVEVEQRKRIFWIVYLLDKEYALRAGRPPCINDDDCNVELPSENPEDQVGNVTCSDGKVTFNIFRVMVTFATIQSKVYMQLYSAKAARQSDGELLNIVGNLDSELEAWKATIPSEFHPDKDLSWLVDRTIAYQILVLHFEYYSLLTTIHRMSIHHGYWTSRLSNYAVSGMSARRLNPRIFSSASLCVSAARSTVGLIKCLDSYDYPCLWYVLMLYYPISSLVTLFSNIVQNPQDPRARSDLGLIGASLDFFRLISKVDELDSCSLLHVDGSYRRVFMLCGEFERIARQVLDKTEKELLSKRKRKSQPNPSPSHAQRRQPQDQDQEPQGPGTANSSTFTWSPETNVFTPPDSQSTITNDSVFPIEHNLNPQHCQPFPEPNSFSWPINNFDSPPVTTNDHSMPLVAPSSFEQPFVPQDLWQIPMAFEWDWADLSGSAPTPWDCTYCAL